MGIFRRLSTLRHGRGFGVHSPLGYELISSVLRDRPAYYADRRINEMFDHRRQQRIGRILLRLIARFEPSTVHVPTHYAPVVSLVCSTTLLTTDDNAEMRLTEENGVTVITYGHPTPGHGPLTLDNENDLRIVIYRRGLSPTYINVRL